MTLPIPQVGQVISYSYLWKDESDKGHESGAKDRPCVVIVAIPVKNGETDVYVFPITSREPADMTTAIEIPAAIKKRLRLNASPSWIITSEWNRFRWPGPDIRPAPGNDGIYGWLSQGLLDQVKERAAAQVRAKTMRTIHRTE
jgi:hypothetical protein